MLYHLPSLARAHICSIACYQNRHHAICAPFEDANPLSISSLFQQLFRDHYRYRLLKPGLLFSAAIATPIPIPAQKKKVFGGRQLSKKQVLPTLPAACISHFSV